MQELATFATGRADGRLPRFGKPVVPFVFDTISLWRGTQPLLAMLRQRYGHLRLADLEGSYGWVLKYDQREKAAANGIETLGDYLDLFGCPTATPLPYITHLSVNRHLPALRGLFATPPQFAPNWAMARGLDRLSGPELFLGPAGSGFGPIHVDHAAVHVGFWQISGAKRFVLFPPQDARYLYRYRGKQFPYQLRNSRVTVAEHRNVQKFPLLRYTHPLTLVLREGQCLFLPADWWHGTENLSHSVSYSIRIVNHTNVLRTLAQYALGVPRALLRMAERRAARLRAGSCSGPGAGRRNAQGATASG